MIMLIKMFLIFLFYFHSVLLSQEESNISRYAFIRGLIEDGKIQEAQKKIDDLPELKGDPTLTQYQTEIWIRQGDFEFEKQNYKKALAMYEKSAPHWLFNPLIQERLKDIREKMKDSKDSNLSASLKSESKSKYQNAILSQNDSINKSAINLIILDENFSRELKESIKLGYSNKTESDSDKYFIPFVILSSISILLNLVLTFFIWKKK